MDAPSPSRGPACIYARQSKPRPQHGRGPSDVTFDVQVEDTRRKLLAEGFTVAEEDVFRENFTGVESIDDRPVLVEIRRRIEQGRYKALGTWKADRLGRGFDVYTVLRTARSAGCILLFAHDPDPNDEDGEFILMIMAAMSKREVHLIDQRCRGARRSIRDRGDWLGNGPVRDGYLWIKETRSRVADPDRAPLVRRIFRLAAEGTSCVRIARLLNAGRVPTPGAHRARLRGEAACWFDWQAGNVARYLRERTYLGNQVFDRSTGTPERRGTRRVRVAVPEAECTVRPCARTEPLVDRETFDRAQLTLKDKGWHADQTRTESKPFLLRGFLYCGICGRRMVPQNHLKEPNRCGYRCYSYLKAKANGTPPCRPTLARRSLLDPAIWSEVEERIAGADVEREARRLLAEDADRAIEADLEATRDGLARARKRLGHLADSLGDEDSRAVRDAIKRSMHDVESGIADLEAAEARHLARLAPYRDRGATLDRFLAVVATARAEIGRPGGLTLGQKRELMKGLGVRVTFTAEERLRLEFHTLNDPDHRQSCYQNHDGELHDATLVVGFESNAPAPAGKGADHAFG